MKNFGVFLAKINYRQNELDFKPLRELCVSSVYSVVNITLFFNRRTARGATEETENKL